MDGGRRLSRNRPGRGWLWQGRGQRIPTAVEGHPTGRCAGPVVASFGVATATWPYAHPSRAPLAANLPQTLCPWWLAKGSAAFASDRAADGPGGVAVGGGPGLVEQRYEGIAGDLTGDMAEGAVATRPDLVSDLILRAADDQ